MKYVRNIEDLKNYTFEFFDSFLPQNLSDQMVNYFLLEVGNKQELMAQVFKQIQSTPLTEDAVAEYGEVILQIRDYKDLLKRFVEFLLICKAYEQLSAFLNRIFLQQVGNIKYRSHGKDYTISQRYFDRFIEIVKYCSIDKSLFSPFFMAIFNSNPTSKMFNYKEPLQEYLDVFLKNDNSGFADKLINNDNPQVENIGTNTNVGITREVESREIETEDDSEKLAKQEANIRAIVEDYIYGNPSSNRLVRTAINQNKELSFNIIESYLDGSDEQLLRACHLLAIFEDKKAIDDLKYIYDNTTNEDIKRYLEGKCGFKSLKKFSSQDAFLSYVSRNVSKIQDRLYGIRLARYYQKFNLDNTGMNGKVMTFILDTFRNKESDDQISEFKEYFKYVDNYVLQSLCDIVFEVATEREKLLSSKWAIRLISTFGSPLLLQKVFENMKTWYLVPDLQKPCEYFMDIMSECKRHEIIDGIRELLDLDLTPRQRKVLEKKLSAFSHSNKEDLEQVKDKLVSDLGFDRNGQKILKLNKRSVLAQINIDCSISLYNIETNKPARINDSETYNWENVHTYIKNCENKIKQQRKRLYSAFLEYRNYTSESFKECILQNNLLNFLSQHIFWGRYKNDNLVEVCVIRDNKLSHVIGNVITQEEEYAIAMLQPIDSVDIKNKIEGQISLLFNQFDLPYFTSYDIDTSLNYVDKLSGAFCNAQLFITRLQKLKYKIGDLDENKTFGMLVKRSENLNLITTVEFERVPLNNYNCNTTVSKVRFYDLNKQNMSGKKAKLDKSQALVLNNINPHVLSNELGIIFNACKSKQN